MESNENFGSGLVVGMALSMIFLLILLLGGGGVLLTGVLTAALADNTSQIHEAPEVEAATTPEPAVEVSEETTTEIPHDETESIKTNEKGVTQPPDSQEAETNQEQETPEPGVDTSV